MWKFLGLALLLTAFFATLARAEPKLDVTPCQCALQGIQLEGKPWSMELLSNGLADYMIDLNGDGLADIEFLVPDGDANRIPLFYWINGEDGQARYTLEDSRRTGDCKGMKVIWDKFRPNWRKGA